MTHCPPNGLLVFLCQAISVSPYTSLLVRTCWPYTDRLSPDHTLLSSHVALCATDVRQQYCWSTAAASGTPAEDMAAKAGWICSADSSGSASSLCSIQCVRALSRYTVVTPVEQQIIDRRVGFEFDHDNYHSIAKLTDAGLLQVHVNTVNVVAPYTDIYTKKWCQISSASLRKDTSVCPNNLISISVTISISASWFVGELVVGEFDCRRVGLSASCPVTVSNYQWYGMVWYTRV